MSSFRIGILSAVIWSLHTVGFAETYTMPSSNPLTQDEIQVVLNTLVDFVPKGEHQFTGIDPQGRKCQVSLDLEKDGFTFTGLPLAFGLGGGGDNVDFFLVKQLAVNLPDASKTLDLAIVNRAGFGSDRLVAYNISSKDETPLTYETSWAIANGKFTPGQKIQTVPFTDCRQLKKK
jgi:hypothetical protein